MPRLHVDNAAFITKRSMLTAGRISQPGTRRVRPVLIREDTGQHKYFFALRMGVSHILCAGRPFHQCNLFITEFMQGHHLQTLDLSRKPFGLVRIQTNKGLVIGIKLLKLN